VRNRRQGRPGGKPCVPRADRPLAPVCPAAPEAVTVHGRRVKRSLALGRACPRTGMHVFVCVGGWVCVCARVRACVRTRCVHYRQCREFHRQRRRPGLVLRHRGEAASEGGAHWQVSFTALSHAKARPRTRNGGACDSARQSVSAPHRRGAAAALPDPAGLPCSFKRQSHELVGAIFLRPYTFPVPKTKLIQM